MFGSEPEHLPTLYQAAWGLATFVGGLIVYLRAKTPPPLAVVPPPVANLIDDARLRLDLEIVLKSIRETFEVRFGKFEETIRTELRDHSNRLRDIDVMRGQVDGLENRLSSLESRMPQRSR